MARFIQNHYHFILSKSLTPLLTALEVDEAYVAEMCKFYSNDDMDSLARIISKVPVQLVRTSVHPSDVQGNQVVMVNENGEDVIVVLNEDDDSKTTKENNVHPTDNGSIMNTDTPLHSVSNTTTPVVATTTTTNIISPSHNEDDEWDEEDIEDIEDEEEVEEGDEEFLDDGMMEDDENMIILENNESFSIFVGRVLRFLNMSTKSVASFLKYLPEYCTYDEDEILEGLNWNQEQIDEMKNIMKEEQDKIAQKMKELSKLIIRRRLSISAGLNSPNGSSGNNLNSPLNSPLNQNFY